MKSGRKLAGNHVMPKLHPKRIVSFTLRLLFSATLLIVVLRWSDFGEVGKILDGVCWWWLIPAFLVHILGVAAEVLRWLMLLQSRDVKVAKWETVRLLLGARFLNLFLPGSMGGDVYRIYGTHKQAASMLQATGIVLLERLLGLLAAVVVGLLLLPFSSMYHRHPVSFVLLTAGFSGIVLLMVLLSNRHLAGWVASVLVRCRLGRLAQLPGRVSAAVHSFGHARILLLKLLALSGGMKVAVAVQIYFLAVSLGVHFSMADLLVFLPLHIIATSLPISINSLGVREATLVAFFAHAGYDPAQAIGVALLLMGWVYATSLPCVVFLLLGPGEMRAG